MALRLITQARLALRSPATASTTLRAALAQRAALVPLPVRTFSLSRPWLAAEAARAQAKSPREHLASGAESVTENPTKRKAREEPDLAPFSSIEQLVTPETYSAITDKPYKLTHMTPVQSAVLSLLPQLTKHHSELEQVDGKLPARDLLVRAKTGTGKTLAFLVPAIEARITAIERVKKEALEKAGLKRDRIYEARAERAFTRTDAGTLIISPTRELATQIANEALKLTHHHDEFESPERQTMLYSATVSRAIQQVARASLDKNHLFINTVTEEESPVHAHIPQYHTILPKAEDQIPHILRLLAHDQLSNPGKSKSIVFLPTTRMTQMYAQLLRELARDTLPAGRGTQVYEIHSKKEQDQRSRTSDRFRKDTTGASILVTSDVSARGVDYPGVTRVIQVGIPSTSDQYVHRVGRTGRAGTEGRGDLVLLPWEIGFVTWQLTHVPMKATTVKEIEAQLLQLASKHDENPATFYTPPPVPRHVRTAFRGSPQTPVPVSFSPKTTQRVQEIESNVKEVLPQLDPLTVDETFAGLLGYYIAKSPELRVAKSVILQGCKDWATGAAGLPEEPHVSQAFLQRLGYDDGRTKRFGARREEYQPKRWGSAPWSGRGNQRERDRPAPFANQRNQYEERERGFGAREERGFGARQDRGFGRREEGGFGRRDEGRFGRREFGSEQRERSPHRNDENRERRPFNLEDPENADAYKGSPYGRRPRSGPTL
ncbi:hypothetical protein FRC06_004142 [Ceratobasidium sp. 370]|nr:hypothetical protein FRC06_004142 [Ceratobasidium sp. 370]